MSETNEIWISPSNLRNFFLDDPIIDWLEIYGKKYGYNKDSQIDKYYYPDFILNKGNEFEKKIYDHLNISRFSGNLSPEIHSGNEIDVELEKVVNHLKNVPDLTGQVFLVDKINKLHGYADLIVSANWFRKMYSLQMDEIDENFDGLIIGDIKFKSVTKKLSSFEIEMQVFIYTKILANLGFNTTQGAFLLVRNPSPFTTSENNGKVFWIKFNSKHEEEYQKAVNWYIWLRNNGGKFSPENVAEDYPDLFYPNMSEDSDEWSEAKKIIAENVGELTQLSGIGLTLRDKFFKLTPPVKTIEQLYACKNNNEFWNQIWKKPGKIYNRLLANLISISENRIYYKENEKIESKWVKPALIELFVDFETFNNINDDFTKFPEISGTPMIFMIGCGEIINGKWEFECFIAQEESNNSENQIIKDFLSYIEKIKEVIGSDDVRIYHWWTHEVSEYKKALKKHPDENYPENLPWIDLGKDIWSESPISIQNQKGFSLKTVAKLLNYGGQIRTIWPSEGLSNGMTAQIAAFDVYKQCRDTNQPVKSNILMNEIRDYNEVDCKVMWEILDWMRTNLIK